MTTCTAEDESLDELAVLQQDGFGGIRVDRELAQQHIRQQREST